MDDGVKSFFVCIAITPRESQRVARLDPLVSRKATRDRRPGKSVLSGRTFTGWGLVTDIMKEVSYGAYDTLALKGLKL